MQHLPADQRTALELRYLQGKSVVEAAALMGKIDRAVQMLCHRGLAKLQEQMGGSRRGPVPNRRPSAAKMTQRLCFRVKNAVSRILPPVA